MDLKNKIRLLATMDNLLNDNEGKKADEWISRKDAAHKLQCSTRHLIRKYEKTGRLKNYNTGGWAMYRASEVNAIIEGER